MNCQKLLDKDNKKEESYEVELMNDKRKNEKGKNYSKWHVYILVGGKISYTFFFLLNLICIWYILAGKHVSSCKVYTIYIHKCKTFIIFL